MLSRKSNRQLEKTKEEKLQQKRNYIISSFELKNEEDIFLNYFKWSCVLLVIFIVTRFFFSLRLIGGDSTYLKYILLPSLMIGILSYTYLRRALLMYRLRKKEIRLEKIKEVSNFFALVIILSFVTFGLISDLIWRISNEVAISKNKVEIIHCPINEFHKSRSNSHMVTFIFNDNEEYLDFKYDKKGSVIQSNNPIAYEVVITIRKGIWGYYHLKDWEIIEK